LACVSATENWNFVHGGVYVEIELRAKRDWCSISGFGEQKSFQI